MPDSTTGSPPRSRPRWSRVAASAWLVAVAIVGAAAPLLARGGSDPAGWAFVPWSHDERLNDRNVARLEPGAWTTDVVIQRVLTAWDESRDGRPDGPEHFRRRLTSMAMDTQDIDAVVSWIAGAGDAPDTERLRERLRQTRAARPFHLGTDAFGQDVLSNIIHACRTSLLIGLTGAGVALLLGVTIGALMGYFGGWTDLLTMRLVEVFMSVPVMFLLVLGSAVLPRNTVALTALIGCVSWTSVARLTRAEIMRVKGSDFVAAARASGLGPWRIIARHVLPSALTPARVEAGFLFAAAILAEATLSFLGLSTPDGASWGRLLAQAVGSGGDFAWWLAVFPGGCLFLTVLSCHTLSDRGGATRGRAL